MVEGEKPLSASGVFPLVGALRPSTPWPSSEVEVWPAQLRLRLTADSTLMEDDLRSTGGEEGRGETEGEGERGGERRRGGQRRGEEERGTEEGRGGQRRGEEQRGGERGREEGGGGEGDRGGERRGEEQRGGERGREEGRGGEMRRERGRGGERRGEEERGGERRGEGNSDSATEPLLSSPQPTEDKDEKGGSNLQQALFQEEALLLGSEAMGSTTKP
ncbi:unnamed protein product [Boreogadus saida]